MTTEEERRQRFEETRRKLAELMASLEGTAQLQRESRERPEETGMTLDELMAESRPNGPTPAGNAWRS